MAESTRNCRAARLAPGVPTSTDRIEVLDGIRGLAALSVALSHCVLNVVGLKLWVDARIFDLWDLSADQVIKRLLVHIFPSTAAVLIFFLLSGHVLWRSFVRKKLSAGDTLDYVCARVFRLFPLVIVTVLPFAYLENASWKQVLANMLLLSNSLNGVLWSLQVEIVGSAVIFAIWLWSRGERFRLFGCLFGLATLVPIFGHVTAIMYLPAFVLGASISAVPGRIWRSRWLLYSGLAVLLGTPLFLPQGLNVSNFFVAIAAMAIVGCVEAQRPRFLQSRAANFLGRVDGFDQDEAESKRDERAVILRRLLASKCDTLEALELANRLFDACPRLVECFRKEGGHVFGVGSIRDRRAYSALARGFAI